MNKSALFTAVLALLLGACATRSTTRVETSERTPQPVISHPDVEIDTGMDDTTEVDESPYPSPAETQTQTYPTASNPAAESLVAKGIAQLDQNQLESAEWHLEEAIRLAPQYGPAYYWMAKVKSRAGEYEQAASFLNKADSLAPADSNWQNRIDSLRREIAATPQN